ncbi:hypothetical protein MRX96_023326 [Rhipicephalus microplus]
MAIAPTADDGNSWNLFSPAMHASGTLRDRSATVRCMEEFYMVQCPATPFRGAHKPERGPGDGGGRGRHKFGSLPGRAVRRSQIAGGRTGEIANGHALSGRFGRRDLQSECQGAAPDLNNAYISQCYTRVEKGVIMTLVGRFSERVLNEPSFQSSRRSGACVLGKAERPTFSHIVWAMLAAPFSEAPPAQTLAKRKHRKAENPSRRRVKSGDGNQGRAFVAVLVDVAGSALPPTAMDNRGGNFLPRTEAAPVRQDKAAQNGAGRRHR